MFLSVLAPSEFEAAKEIAVGLQAQYPAAREGEQAGRLRTRLADLAAKHDPAVFDGVVERVDREGHRRLYVEAVTFAGGSQFVTLPSGQVVEFAATRSVPGKRSKEKSGPAGYQPRLFPELTLADLEYLAAYHLGQRDSHGLEFERVVAGIALMKKHPDAATFGEACEREGLDWRDFDATGLIGP